MIENEIAKFVNLVQPRVQLLLVAEFGEAFCVAVNSRIWHSGLPSRPASGKRCS